MGIQFGPRIPQATNTLIAIDPASGKGVSNAYTNLISAPENFNSWGQIAVTVQANAATAPDGTNTASIITDTTASSQHTISISASITTAGKYTVSIFAKAGTLNTIGIVANNSQIFRQYNLTTGIDSSWIGTNPDASGMVFVGNGWYRCWFTSTMAVNETIIIYFISNGNFTYTGNGAASIQFWGAQVTPGTTLTDYFAQSVISNTNRLSIITNPLSTVNTSVSTINNTIQGQVEYTTPGVYNWLCPAGVTSVSVVAVGGGGGGGFGDSFGAGGAGGNLRYVNNIPVVPGQSYQVIVGEGGAVAGAGQTSRNGGASSFGGNLVIAQGGQGGGTSRGTAVTSNNVGIGSDGGSGGINGDGGGGGAGGYIPQPVAAGILQVSTNQFDATSLGAVRSIDDIASHPSASILPSSGFLKYFIATALGPREITVSFRRTGSTLSQSAFTVEGGILQYTSSTSSILFYANDDHDTLWVDADGAGIISRTNTNTLNTGNFDKFRGTQELILNQSLDVTARFPQSAVLGAATSQTVVSFPLTNSSVTFNLTSGICRVNNGSNFFTNPPLSGIGAGASANSIWTISDGVNQFMIGRYGSTTAYLVTVDLVNNGFVFPVQSVTLSASPAQTNATEEDAIGTQLFTVDGVVNWCSNTQYFYGGTSDWKTNTNVFNTSGRLSFTAGSFSTQTDMDIWGSIDTNGYVWFADWGHDDGGLFGIGNDDRLNIRQTNIRYVPTFASASLTGPGGGVGGGNFATQPSSGVGGGGGGGGSGSGAAGGGGVGLAGYTNDGAAGTTRPQSVDGIQQGGGGSGGTGGAIKNQGANSAVQSGGLYGGGGGGGFGAGPGGRGAVRIMWGPGRSFPFNATNVEPLYGSSSTAASLVPAPTLNSVNYENGYLIFNGTTSSYAAISNVPTSEFLTINAAVFLSNWTTATGTFVSNADTDGTTRYQLGINNASYSGQVGAIFRTRIGNLAVGFSRAGISAGWHILTATFDGSAARLYIDGSLVATANASSATLLESVNFNTLTLGARLSGTTVSEAVACRIGNLLLLNQAYSASDVTGYFSAIRGRYGI